YPNKTAIRLAVLLTLLVISPFQSVARAQAVYAENQIPLRGVEISYAVTIQNPISHLYNIDLEIRGLRTTSVDVAMPAWEPGNYTIRDFAKNVQDFRAATSTNQPLNWTQTDKLTWRVIKQQQEDLAIRYQVFSTRLTDEMADIAGPSLYMYV